MGYRRYFVIFFIHLILASLPVHARQRVVSVFDIDDNVFDLGDLVVLRFKDQPEKLLEMTSEELSLFRLYDGQDVILTLGGQRVAAKDLEVFDGTYRYFTDWVRKDQFQVSLVKVFDKPPDTWQRRSWPVFRWMLSQPLMAMDTWVLSGRGHEPKNFVSGLEPLRDEGLIKYLPAVENVWMTYNADFLDRFERFYGYSIRHIKTSTPAEPKAYVLKEILDTLRDEELEPTAEKVLAPDGQSEGVFHLFGFSDDDYTNFETARDFLQRHLDDGHWPQVKITLFFTGQNHRLPPHAIVLQPHGRPRPYTETEEWQTVALKLIERHASCQNLLEGVQVSPAAGVGVSSTGVPSPPLDPLQSR